MQLNPRKYTMLFHVFFWIGLLLLFFLVYYTGVEIKGVSDIRFAFGYSLITAIFAAFLVYFNMYYLLPNYFYKHKYIVYYFIITILIIVITLIYDLLFKGWIFPIDPEIGSHIPKIIASLIIMLLLSGSLKAMEQRYKHVRIRQELKNYQLEAELRFLRTQINPHFLFNVLNNIYALAYTGSKETATVIAKLSDMMRYMLESGSEEKVKLVQEVHYLKDYIALQQLKKAKPQNIDFQLVGSFEEVWIEPMLFIPFFENCFKHSNVEDLDKGWIKSKLELKKKEQGSQILFHISNTFEPQQKNGNSITNNIGLSNVEKRLQLLYPERHHLNIIQKDRIFIVNLKINLN